MPLNYRLDSKFFCILVQVPRAKRSDELLAFTVRHQIAQVVERHPNTVAKRLRRLAQLESGTSWPCLDVHQSVVAALRGQRGETHTHVQCDHAKPFDLGGLWKT